MEYAGTFLVQTPHSGSGGDAQKHIFSTLSDTSQSQLLFQCGRDLKDKTVTVFFFGDAPGVGTGQQLRTLDGTMGFDKALQELIRFLLRDPGRS